MKTIYSSISKRVFSLLVALIMAISTVPFAAASAFAQEQGISITTSTITPNTKSIEVTLAQGITTGFAKVIQLDSGEEYDTTKLFSYTDLSGVIGYTALNEGSNTITLTTAPTEGKEVIAVLRDQAVKCRNILLHRLRSLPPALLPAEKQPNRHRRKFWQAAR